MKNKIAILQNKITILQIAILQNKVTASQLIAIFIIPPLVLAFFPALRSLYTNIITIACCTFACIIIIIKEGWKWPDFHLNIEKQMIGPYIGFTVAGLLFLMVAVPLVNWMKGGEFSIQIKKELLKKDFLKYVLIVIICLLQAFSYKTFLFKKLSNFTQEKWTLILLNTGFFTIMHAMFPWGFIGICCFGGLGFAYIYYHYQSLVLMTISHTILNFTAALLGAFQTY